MWTEKIPCPLNQAENRKTPDQNGCTPPSPESWSVPYSYIFISKLSTARIHSGHEANWQVLATSTLLNSFTPNTEWLHPNCWLEMVSGQRPCPVGVGRNHAREFWTMEQRGWWSPHAPALPWHSTVGWFRWSQGESSSRNLPEKLPTDLVMWINMDSTISVTVWKTPHAVSSGKKVWHGV